jgi:CRISPR/Cas system CSM-associated protein Csm5 (group 7 of RAMP superfamily)
MNGLRWTDYAPEKQQELLEALLEDSAATYNFQRATKDHAIPELVRYFYKEQESTTTAATNKDARTFHIHADMDSSQMSKASKDQVEIKIENPKKQEFVTALKTANQGIKRLERLYNDAQKLSAQLQASLPEKHKEFQKQLDTFSIFSFGSSPRLPRSKARPTWRKMSARKRVASCFTGATKPPSTWTK